MWLDYEAALQASKRGLEQLCINGAHMGHGERTFDRNSAEYFAGIGGAWSVLALNRNDATITEDFAFNSFLGAFSGNINGSNDVARTYCFEVSSGIEFKLIDSNTGWNVILPPGRNIVTVPDAIGTGRDLTGEVRCLGGKCSATLSGRTTSFEVYAVQFYTGGEDRITEYWSTIEGLRIDELEMVLKQIRVNWLDWYDRIDRGHPVFEVETDDLRKQCERAAILTAELDALGATEYREWFDVCDEP